MQSAIDTRRILDVRIVYRVGYLAYSELCTEKPLQQRYSVAGNEPWVVVTRSTSGIGWALALQFAKRRLNLVLHGRNEDQLKGKRKTVQDLYPKVEAKLLVTDLDKCAVQGFFEGIKNELQGLDIAVLVNNAAVVGTILGNDNPELNHQCVLVNCMAQSMMTHYFIN